MTETRLAFDLIPSSLVPKCNLGTRDPISEKTFEAATRRRIRGIRLISALSAAHILLLRAVMNRPSQAQILSDDIIDSRRLITGLRHALDVNYARVLQTARMHWERHFEGNDPSDACVHVRITSGKPSAGVIKKPAGSILYGTRQLTA